MRNYSFNVGMFEPNWDFDKMWTVTKFYSTFRWIPPKNWHDLSRSSGVRSWPRNGQCESPFHAGRIAPIRKMIGGDSPERICIDVAHTYAIAGYGKDELASTLILLSVRCNVWGNANFEVQLARAYDSFSNWCAQHKKTTTILEFSKKELKIQSLLESTCLQCMDKLVYVVPLYHHLSEKWCIAVCCSGCKLIHADWERDQTLRWLGRGWNPSWLPWTNPWCQTHVSIRLSNIRVFNAHSLKQLRNPAGISLQLQSGRMLLPTNSSGSFTGTPFGFQRRWRCVLWKLGGTWQNLVRKKSWHICMQGGHKGCSHTCAQEGYGALARLAKTKGWNLYYMRPKVHMMQHVVLLWGTYMNPCPCVSIHARICKW